MKKAIISLIVVLMVTGVAFAERWKKRTTAKEQVSYTQSPTTIADEQTAVSEKGVQEMLISETKPPATISDEYTAAENEYSVTQSPTAMLEETIAKKRGELKGTKWSIELKLMGTGKRKGMTEKDVLSFSETKIKSDKLTALGYPATGYSTRLETDGTLIWETMQKSEEDGTAFWRGDIGPDGVVRGVLSKRNQTEKGEIAQDFNFIGEKQ